MRHRRAGIRPCQAILVVVDERVEADVSELKKMLEQELDRSLNSQFGCWPLVVGVLGVLLGVALLVGLL